MGTELGPHHGVTEKREADLQKAERIVGIELRKRHWTKQDLKERGKTDQENEAGVAAAPVRGNDDDGGLDCGASAHRLPGHAGKLLEGANQPRCGGRGGVTKLGWPQVCRAIMLPLSSAAPLDP